MPSTSDSPSPQRKTGITVPANPPAVATEGLLLVGTGQPAAVEWRGSGRTQSMPALWAWRPGPESPNSAAQRSTAPPLH
jgi:hypothetical protein